MRTMQDCQLIQFPTLLAPCTFLRRVSSFRLCMPKVVKEIVVDREEAAEAAVQDSAILMCASRAARGRCTCRGSSYSKLGQDVKVALHDVADSCRRVGFVLE